MESKLVQSISVYKRSVKRIDQGDFDKINTKYKHREISSELVRTIGKITESTELIKHGSSGEVTNMCTALDQLVENGRKEGYKNGRDEGYKSGRDERTKELILNWTKEDYSVSMIAKLLKETEDFVRSIQEEAKVLA